MTLLVSFNFEYCFTKFAAIHGYKDYNPINFIAKKIYDKNPLAKDLYKDYKAFSIFHIAPQFNHGNFKNDFSHEIYNLFFIYGFFLHKHSFNERHFWF